MGSLSGRESAMRTWQSSTFLTVCVRKSPLEEGARQGLIRTPLMSSKHSCAASKAAQGFGPGSTHLSGALSVKLAQGFDWVDLHVLECILFYITLNYNSSKDNKLSRLLN